LVPDNVNQDDHQNKAVNTGITLTYTPYSGGIPAKYANAIAWLRQNCYFASKKDQLITHP